MQDVDNRENWRGGKRGVCGNSLYFPINFSVNLKLLLKNLLIKNLGDNRK